MELDTCEQCSQIACGGACAAWVDGVAHSVPELVRLWGIQARQVEEHLENGTHPRCADGSIVRRISDEVRVRPCAMRGGVFIVFEVGGQQLWEIGLSSAAAALGVPRSSLRKLIQEPGRPIPASWGCEALRSDLGWHYRAPLAISNCSQD